tara:strand:- start:1447 stop:2286 length:840 start_codon:yes stop_codon:yes gene_type:complete
MKFNHNKKRNIGLVYELLLRSISSSLVEGDQKKANLSIEIMKKRFAPGTEIYSEFRIFNAIMNTTVTNTSVAAGILTEAKNAIKNIDYEKLYVEKSKLISEINKQIKDNNFFKRKVPNYKQFATVGTCINHWRKGDMSNLSQQVINEQRLIEFMLLEKNDIPEIQEMTDDNANNLVVKIMTEKINNNYKDLNLEQKRILREYAVYGSSDIDQFESFLNEIKSKSLKSLDNLKQKTDNKVLLSKIDVVRNKIKNLAENNINDVEIAKYLKISELKSQLGG